MTMFLAILYFCYIALGAIFSELATKHKINWLTLWPIMSIIYIFKEFLKK